MWAQSEQREQPPRGYFRLISWEGSDDGVYYFRDEKKVPVTFSPFAKSEFYPLPAPGPLKFFRDGKNEKGEPAPVLAGSANFDPHWNHPLLIAFPASDSSGQLTFMAQDENPGTFKAGNIRLINLTKVPIQGSLSGQRVNIAPQRDQTIDLASTALKVVDVELNVEENAKWKPVYQRGWELEPGMRITALIVKNPEGRFQVRRLREGQSTFVPTVPEPAKPKAVQ